VGHCVRGAILNLLKKNRDAALYTVFFLILFTGCGKIVQRNAISSMSKLFARHFDVFTSEADPVLAEAPS